jgi:LacI family transcriptional regulator
VQHLIDHGRRRVGFVGATAEHRFGVERLDGYRDAILDAGREYDERLTRLDHPSRLGGYRATAALLRERPDAIYASTDPMAAGAYRAVREAGLRIPDDVAVVGFDGLPSGPQLEPSLTTVVQPVVDVGRTAVRVLAGGEEPPQLVMLPTTLRVADSCGGDHRSSR